MRRLLSASQVSSFGERELLTSAQDDSRPTGERDCRHRPMLARERWSSLVDRGATSL